jgi:hypothetical protein
MDGQAKELQGDMAEMTGQTFLKSFIWFVLILLYSCRCRRKGAPPQYRVGSGVVPARLDRCSTYESSTYSPSIKLFSSSALLLLLLLISHTASI